LSAAQLRRPLRRDSAGRRSTADVARILAGVGAPAGDVMLGTEPLTGRPHPGGGPAPRAPPRPGFRSGGPGSAPAARAPPRPSEPVGVSNCDKWRHQRAVWRRSGALPAGSGTLRGRHARIGPPRWPPGLDCGPGQAIRRLTSNICHNRAPAAPAGSLRAPARHLPGRLAAQVAPLARRADNVHRHAQRVGHVLEYEIGRADRVSGGAEDGVPGFDRSFTMHPRPSTCVQDRPGDTSAATRTLSVTE
jgi:hypothetical protein